MADAQSIKANPHLEEGGANYKALCKAAYGVIIKITELNYSRLRYYAEFLEKQVHIIEHMPGVAQPGKKWL